MQIVSCYLLCFELEGVLQVATLLYVHFVCISGRISRLYTQMCDDNKNKNVILKN